ncbi:MAG: hypothetical protein GY793_04280 [Proteobacteria bacterium]|nr:hypothetical protein [Pseudomonadota bacterium]
MGQSLSLNYQKRAEFEHILKQTLLSLEKDSAKQLSKTELDAFVNKQVGYILSDLFLLINQCHHQSKRCHSVTSQCHCEEQRDAAISKNIAKINMDPEINSG